MLNMSVPTDNERYSYVNLSIDVGISSIEDTISSFFSVNNFDSHSRDEIISHATDFFITE